MKILLHGATNKKNFGDFMYAKMFYDYFSYNFDVYFYEFPKFGINKYYKENLNYTSKGTLLSQLKCDCLILFAGGYFGEKKKSLLKSFIRYFRYFFIADIYRLFHKPIYIIGVGGSPVYNDLLRKKIIKIIEYSRLFIVRDSITSTYYSSNGVRREIITLPDLALSYDIKNCKNVKRINNDNSKNILLHIYGNKSVDSLIKNKIVAGINKFILNSNEYIKIFITYDNSLEKDNLLYEIFDSINCDNKEIIYYNSPLDILDVICNTDLVITTKLHVGVYSALLNKSVLAFSMHYDKTSRFYSQINEAKRCFELSKITSNDVYFQIKKYINYKIDIDNELINQSKIAFELLKKDLLKVGGDELEQ